MGTLSSEQSAVFFMPVPAYPGMDETKAAELY